MALLDLVMQELKRQLQLLETEREELSKSPTVGTVAGVKAKIAFLDEKIQHIRAKLEGKKR